jgi:hypothetical protein
LHVDETGTLPKPKSQSPKVINAWSQARDSFTRTIFGGVLLSLLTLAYIAALFLKVEGAQSILLLLGSGLGFMLGGRDRSVAGEG